MKVTGINNVVNALRTRAAKFTKDPNVVVAVGFSTAYAIHVHENIQMAWRGLPRDRTIRRSGGIAYTGYAKTSKLPGVFWGPTGQAKFLEQPARQLSNDGTLASIVATALQAGKTMAQALVLAGLRIQREAQKLVPVVTGTLKNSAFTVLEKSSTIKAASQAIPVRPTP